MGVGHWLGLLERHAPVRLIDSQVADVAHRFAGRRSCGGGRMPDMPRWIVAAVVVLVLAVSAGAWFLRPHDTVAGCEAAATKQIDAALAAGKDAPEAHDMPECD